MDNPSDDVHINLFAGGPPLKLQRQLRMANSDTSELSRRITIVILVGWVPLVILTTLQSLILGEVGFWSFLSDFSVHARSLVALPLLIMGDSVLILQLSNIARHFLDSGLILEKDREKFTAAAMSTRRLRDSKLVEAAALVIAYAIVALLVYSVPLEYFPAWIVDPDGNFTHMSFAGIWHSLVSTPILLLFILGMLWRLFLWARFIWLISRLDLQLFPAHPDRLAGMRFAGFSLRAFSAHGMALGFIVAGDVANQVVHHGEKLASFLAIVVVLVCTVVVLIGLPLLFFGGNMLRARRRAAFIYSSIGIQLGLHFNRQLFGLEKRDNNELPTIENEDVIKNFFPLTESVNNMALFPIDFGSLRFLVGSTLVPFLFVALISLPFDEVLSGLGKLLL